MCVLRGRDVSHPVYCRGTSMSPGGLRLSGQSVLLKMYVCNDLMPAWGQYTFIA